LNHGRPVNRNAPGALGGLLLIVLARRHDAKLLGELCFQKPLDYSALIFRDVRISKALLVESDILCANEPVHAAPHSCALTEIYCHMLAAQ
jgi:hypothetical protein